MSKDQRNKIDEKFEIERTIESVSFERELELIWQNVELNWDLVSLREHRTPSKTMNAIDETRSSMLFLSIYLK